VNDKLDTHDEKNEEKLPHYELTRVILSCCFEVMKELGPGFLERIYKNALLLTLKEVNLQVETEKPFEVVFKNKVIGRYNADLVVEKKVIVELKCCENLVREHQAQLFNYLRVSGLPIGLLVNFRRRRLEYQRLHQPEVKERDVEELLPF
jgi:GxxExxY protein